MDINMPGMNGIETTRLVCNKYPDIKVIMLTIYEDEQYISEAIQVGAKGYVTKKVQREELVEIVHHVLRNKAFLDPNVTVSIFNLLKERPEGQYDQKRNILTQRETEVLREIVTGKSDREISDSLCISEHTVRSHVKSLFRKMNVSSRTKAIHEAIQNKIVGPEN
jgi:two-component system response regulator DegU